MHLFDVTEILTQPVDIVTAPIGRPVPLSRWIEFHDVFLVRPTPATRPTHVVPLQTVVVALAFEHDLGEREMDTMEKLAPEWEGTWGELLDASILL